MTESTHAGRPTFADAHARFRGPVFVLGDDINTDLNCSGKYLPGKDENFIAAQAFDAVSPGFAARFTAGGIIVAGTHFGINSSREQAVHILRRLGGHCCRVGTHRLHHRPAHRGRRPVGGFT